VSASGEEPEEGMEGQGGSSDADEAAARRAVSSYPPPPPGGTVELRGTVRVSERPPPGTDGDLELELDEEAPEIIVDEASEDEALEIDMAEVEEEEALYTPPPLMSHPPPPPGAPAEALDGVEAAAAEQAVAEPAIAETEAAEPAVAEPAIAETEAAEPAVAEPAVVEPAAAELEAAPSEAEAAAPEGEAKAPEEALAPEGEPEAAEAEAAEPEVEAAAPEPEDLPPQEAPEEVAAAAPSDAEQVESPQEGVADASGDEAGAGDSSAAPPEPQGAAEPEQDETAAAAEVEEDLEIEEVEEEDPEGIELHEVEAEAPPPPFNPPPVPAEGEPAAEAAAATPPPSVRPAPRKRKRPWFEGFFNDDYLRTVPPPSPKEVRRQCDFIERELGLERGATILDVGCGLGMHAVELANRGYLLVGLDLSLAMLSRAGDEAQDRGLKINFLHGDMREMAFDGAFDAVLCWGTTFGYFDDEANRQVIARLYNALKPRGLLLLDVVNRDFVISKQPNLIWFEGDGCVCMEETNFNSFTSRLEVKRTVILDDGRQRETRYSVRLYALHELGQLLHQQGFRVAEVSGAEATRGVYLGSDSPRLIILAERRPSQSTPPPSESLPPTPPPSESLPPTPPPGEPQGPAEGNGEG
jgi:SAM-dependent methyltransferase